MSRGRRQVLGAGLACPPCNIGPLSTPNYATALAQPAVHKLHDGSKVFAGQRAEGFYVDLGSIFDLLNLRPIQELNVFAKALGLMSAAGVNSTAGVNVHSLAVQVPMSLLTRDGNPPTASTGTIGVWTTASRQQVRILEGGFSRPDGMVSNIGPWVQVSRLGNPLFNEVLIPMSTKIIVDLTLLTQMDSMGLGTIVSLYVSAKASGCQLILVNLSQRVRELFRITNVWSLLEVYGDNIIRLP